MSEPNHEFLESGQGARPPTTSGDRLMVLLAMVALIGGLLIATSKLLPSDPNEIAEATAAPSTPAPSPSRTPRPSPTERPLGQLLVEPGEPPSIDTGEDWTSTWVRARDELVIRASPQANGFEVGRLARGAAALTQASPDGGRSEVEGWLWIVEPAPSGWISVEGGPGTAVDLVQMAWSRGTTVWETYAGAAGFLAFGESDGSRFIAASPDGETWRRVADPIAFGYQGAGLVWGPAGWLSITSGFWADSANASWVWHSADGVSWSSLGSLRDRFGGIWAQSLTGSETGYLAQLAEDRGGASWWFSPNGLTWSEMPAADVSTDVVVGGPTGFYAWPRWETLDPGASTAAHGAFTTGESWQQLEDGPVGPISQVMPLGDGWLGMDHDPGSGAIRVWIGSVRGGAFSWDAPTAPPAFDGSALALLTGDTRTAVAITWDRSTEEVRTWRTPDGSSWTQIDTPDGGFGTIPHTAAGSRAGVLVMGAMKVNDRTTSALWRLDGGLWQAIHSAAVEEQPSPPLACPPPPADALDLGILDEATAVRCFGHAPLTVRGYSVPGEQCYGCDDGTFEPAWLSWSSEGLSLMPFETGGSWFRSAALDPSVKPSSAWDGAWVEVTGHFDDPAAQNCRQELTPETEAWYPGRQQLIEDCRGRFVVTAVTVVDGP